MQHELVSVLLRGESLAGGREGGRESGVLTVIGDLLPAQPLLLFELFEEDVVLRIPTHGRSRSLGPKQASKGGEPRSREMQGKMCDQLLAPKHIVALTVVIGVFGVCSRGRPRRAFCTGND